MSSLNTCIVCTHEPNSLHALAVPILPHTKSWYCSLEHGTRFRLKAADPVDNSPDSFNGFTAMAADKGTIYRIVLRIILESLATVEIDKGDPGGEFDLGPTEIAAG